MVEVSSKTIETGECWPTEIRLLRDRRHLRVSFDHGATYDIPSELLRVLSPSAEVRGHSEAERKTVGGKRSVEIVAVEAVGNYAVRLTFDDMHSTGIFTWSFLADLGRNAEERLRVYCAELDAKGLTRDLPGFR